MNASLCVVIYGFQVSKHLNCGTSEFSDTVIQQIYINRSVIKFLITIFFH